MRMALGVLVLVGCNAALDLHQTELTPPDADGDGVDDRIDDCPTIPDPSQADADGDGFGDACDFCPDAATTANHDEDGDVRGDECDACPMVADFQADEDGDGLGDACDIAADTDNELLAFDPFLALGAPWSAAGTPWRSTGDSIVVTSQPPSDDPGLANPTLTMVGSRAWQVRFGVTSTDSWSAGDSFGVVFLDADTGARVASCMLECTTMCTLTITTESAVSTAANIPPTPLTDFKFEYYPNFLSCSLGLPGTIANATFPRVTPVLVGSPKVQFRYFAAWQ